MRRTPIVVGGIALAAAVAFATYLSRPRDAAVTAPAHESAALPRSAPAVRASTPAAAPAATVDLTATNVPQPDATAEIDDGDRHESEHHDPLPLETPPPPREPFGADPASQTAALQEARNILEGLQQESDPEVKAQVAKLLESIDTAR